MIRKKKKDAGFTLIELLTVTAIIGILAAIGIIAYGSYVQRARVVAAMNEIIAIVKDIKITYTVENRPAPTHSGDVGTVLLDYSGDLDPWGNPYQYHVPPVRLKADGITLLNSEFDVFSLGPDGLSAPRIDVPVSLDDIIRADDDQYIGKAASYQ